MPSGANGQHQEKPIMKTGNNDNENDLPKIVFFTASSSAVKNKETFTLYWEVQNATQVEIFRNGISYEKPGQEETSLKITEAYDGKDKVYEYSLVASNDSFQEKSLPVHVRVTEIIHKELTPEIDLFKTSANIVKAREAFTLSWEVKNATRIDLYRNGLIFRKLNADKNNINLTESYDGKDKHIEFTIVAFNGAIQTNSDPVSVTVTEKVAVLPVTVIKPEEPTPPIDPVPDQQGRYQGRKETNLKKIRLYLWGLLVTVVLALIVLLYHIQSRPKILDFDPETVVEGHSIVIVGRNFPKDTAKLQVLFNNVKGNVQYSSSEIIRVIVPFLGEQASDGKVTVGLVVKGDTNNASKILMIRKREPGVISFRPDTVSGTAVITDLPKTEQGKKKRIFKFSKDTAKAIPVIKTDSQPVVKPPEPRVEIDIFKMVKVTSNQFKKKTFGGVKNLELTVSNDSPYDLDNVHVEISYMKSNDKKLKNETIVFSNIRAHTKSAMDIPDNNRGSKVDFKIATINSKQLLKDLQR